VGFDDIRFANYLEPALTTIAQPSTEIGKRTVKILLSIIDGKRERMTSQTLPHKLVIRNSTGPLKKR
jgi:LacI family repressor for deo operon, udp, cdd, tsx, nupC, and nupG